MRAAKVITITPTIEAAAYADGDQLGGTFTKLTDAVLSPGGVARLKSVVVLCKAANTVDPVFDILFWDKEPTVASAENAAFDVTDANLANLIGAVSIAAANNFNLANNSASVIRALDLLLQAARPPHAKVTTGRDLWVSLVARAAQTYASTSDLSIKFGFEQL
jgi:hypothetical protein